MKEEPTAVPRPDSRKRAQAKPPGQEDADDNAAPAGHLIVGIGASAGGLDAFRSFLKAMPSDSGMGFVFVQHLAPDYESALRGILQGSTEMPVATACDGCTVAPNTIWVIPQNTILKMDRGTLRTAIPENTTARRSSVDTFFISLARDQGENAVGIILSGFGSDGTTGIGAIKEAGGFTMSEADFDHHAKLGMPQSASDTGYVDTVTEVEKMPAALLAYERARQMLGPHGTTDGSPDLAASLDTICAILHSRLNRDFGQYKTSTLLRRVRRRMQVLRVTDPKDYIEQLRALPDEPDLLFREILIGVTRFFRDAAMFETLAGQVLAALAKQPVEDGPIRVWVAGCATGEEAYSLAILLREACQQGESTRRLIIFATDIDDRAVSFARIGRYSDAIEADISADRLEQHFVRDGNRYRVAKHIRDMCVFSAHDVTKDPPFSRLDLITCRNLLIYFEGALQQRVISTFHYGLKPGGTLWLGPSETISASAKLFKTIDKRARIFQRVDGPIKVPATLPARRRKQGEASSPGPGDPLDEQTARVLARYAPAYVIVDDSHDIQRFSGPVAKYLEPMTGTASFNLFRLLHADLKPAARALLREAETTDRLAQEHSTVLVQGGSLPVNLIVEPLAAGAGRQKTFLVAFQEVALPAPVARISQVAPTNDPSSQDDINTARERLQMVSEELETANEELQSSNEEFQSVNEELHSTVEELETSKEELQSINEELHTVNAELNDRAESLGRSNSDLANLFDSTSIATLFLDGALNIRRFTPAVGDIFNVRPGDEGRPITDFASRLSGTTLTADAEAVLRDLSSVEREVISEDGLSTYLLRIRPYRDLNNVIDGVSITLVDISERKQLDRDRAHLAAIVASSEDAIISHDLDGIITSWNAGAQKIYGYSATDIVGQPMTMLLAETQLDEWPGHLARLRRGDVISNFDISRTAKDARLIHVSLTISPIRDEKGKIVGASAVARDIAQRKASEDRVLLLMAELDHRVKNILAVVSAVVSQTLRGGGPAETIAADIEGRIMAIARTHNLLTDHGGVEGSLSDLVATEIRPFERRGMITVEGPNVILTPKSSLILALAVHELATNAAKYGSLSTGNGRLDVSWSVECQGRNNDLELVWTEADGPPVEPPRHRGFGTKLIEVSLVRGLGAKVEREFEAGGVSCRITIPLVDDVGSIAPRALDD